MPTKKQFKELKALISKESNLSIANKILSLVAKHFNTSIDEIRGSTRKENIIKARSVFCFMAIHFTICTQTEIGGLINRKQTWVKPLYNVVAEAINSENKELCEAVIELRDQIKR